MSPLDATIFLYHNYNILYLHYIKYRETITCIDIFLWSPGGGTSPSLHMTLQQKILESILHTLMMPPAIARNMASQSPLVMHVLIWILWWNSGGVADIFSTSPFFNVSNFFHTPSYFFIFPFQSLQVWCLPLKLYAPTRVKNTSYFIHIICSSFYIQNITSTICLSPINYKTPIAYLCI